MSMTFASHGCFDTKIHTDTDGERAFSHLCRPMNVLRCSSEHSLSGGIGSSTDTLMERELSPPSFLATTRYSPASSPQVASMKRQKSGGWLTVRYLFPSPSFSSHTVPLWSQHTVGAGSPSMEVRRVVGEPRDVTTYVRGFGEPW